MHSLTLCLDQKRKWKERKWKERKWTEEKIERKVYSLFYCLDEERMERKKMRKSSFSCLDREKSKKKENVIISNDYFTLNTI